jgi:hypothetical protein
MRSNTTRFQRATHSPNVQSGASVQSLRMMAVSDVEVRRMSNQIFLSYRRADSQAACDLIFVSLIQAFGKQEVFRDVNSIAAGADFRFAVEQALKRARVTLILIGPQWLYIADDGGHRRLNDPQDRVRQEVELALQSNLVVLPVLVQNAVMPRESDLPASLGPLAYRNARAVRPAPYYAGDLQALIAEIKQYLPAQQRAQPVRQVIGATRAFFGYALTLVTIALTVIALSTWFNIPYLSDFVRRLLGH